MDSATRRKAGSIRPQGAVEAISVVTAATPSTGYTVARSTMARAYKLVGVGDRKPVMETFGRPGNRAEH